MYSLSNTFSRFYPFLFVIVGFAGNLLVHAGWSYRGTLDPADRPCRSRSRPVVKMLGQCLGHYRGVRSFSSAGRFWGVAFFFAGLNACDL